VYPLLCAKAISITYSSVCVCSLSYPARNAHAPCYVVTRGLSDSTIFFTLSHGGRDYLENVTEHTMFMSETFLVLRIIQQDIVKNVKTSSRKVTIKTTFDRF
jgi:hypothetical protein